MWRVLLILILLLGGACSGELQFSHLTLNATQKSFGSFLVSCMAKVPEERVTQVHWKERHSDGKYSMIAVQNPHLGNSTQTPYSMAVKLTKRDDTTYTLEIAGTDKVVCCEVVTYPSGIIRESCLTIGGYSVSGDGAIQAAVLGTGGFFLFASFILLCHIIWMKKRTCRVLRLRGANQQIWNGEQRSRVPYTRTPPSINLAYEPTLDTDILHNQTVQRILHYQRPLGTELTTEIPPPRTPQYQEIPPQRNQWFAESSVMVDPLSFPNFSSVPLHTSSSVNHLYSNVQRPKKMQLKMPYLQNPQNDYPSTPEPGALLHASSTNPVSICPQHVTTASSRIFPRTPDSLLITANPMYHSQTGWSNPR